MLCMQTSTLQEIDIQKTVQSAVREPQFNSIMPKAGMTLGGKFRYARLGFGLTFNEIAEDLKIRVDILKAIERGDFHMIEEPLYRMLMVKTYAEYLGFSQESFQDEYNRESLYAAKKEKSSEVNTESVQKADFVVAPSIVKHILLSAGMIGIFVYLAVIAGNALARPSLTVSSPSDRTVSLLPTIPIKGIASKDANLFINGQSVLKDRDGHFQQTFTLSDGVNSIRVSAAKKYSKEAVITRTVLYERPSIPITLNEGHYGKSSN